jgi:GTP-binding protein
MIIRSAEFSGTVVDGRGALPGTLPQIAFAGRSNVGKSSLINVLLGRTRKKLAHVSGTPGKTQGINFYRVNDRFYLVDLPGFGFARVPEKIRSGWKDLIEGYFEREDGPRAVVQLVDFRRGPTDHDLKLLDYLATLRLPTLVVLTKADKLGREQRAKALPEQIRALGLDPEQVVLFSSRTGEGREVLLDALQDALEGGGE